MFGTNTVFFFLNAVTERFCVVIMVRDSAAVLERFGVR